MNVTRYILFVTCLFAGSIAFAQERTNPKNQDQELGTVSWYRNFDDAQQCSLKENKPILILFQEVPGCATCRNYGHDVLSNPMLVEAIENEFIPMAVFNNKGGKDQKMLKKYNEPSWNNPVVRIVDASGNNLVKRVASNYSAKGLYKAMINALESYGKEIPTYLKLLGKELSYQDNTNIKETYYKMYCFWSGEKQLGNANGVLQTQAGFMNGEVVKVTYDPDQVQKKDLDVYAQKHHMKPVADTGSFNWSKKDEDYYIQHSDYKHIPLTDIQKTKINSALGYQKNPKIYLSPKQLKWLQSIDKKYNYLFTDFNTAWRDKERLSI